MHDVARAQIHQHQLGFRAIEFRHWTSGRIDRAHVGGECHRLIVARNEHVTWRAATQAAHGYKSVSRATASVDAPEGKRNAERMDARYGRRKIGVGHGRRNTLSAPRRVPFAWPLDHRVVLVECSGSIWNCRDEKCAWRDPHIRTGTSVGTDARESQRRRKRTGDDACCPLRASAPHLTLAIERSGSTM